ncbi:MAG: RluA family pseudouridine synthase [Candidatus Kapaibacteriales bacterium]
MSKVNENKKISKDDFIIFQHKIIVPSGKIPERIDTFLTRHLKNVSRTKIQYAIENNDVLVDGKPVKANFKAKPNQEITCRLRRLPPLTLIPEPIPLDIVYEDDYLMLINKPAGIVTHPGYGNRQGTIVNALLFHLGYREPIKIAETVDLDIDSDEGEIFSSPEVRPGIVHRLDKDTSGLLLISKDPSIHQNLAEQFSNRTIQRYYYALVWGIPQNKSGTFSGDIGRSPKDRKLFAVVRSGGKPAFTDYWVLEEFLYLSLVKVKLRTGRTHQIRVHFSSNGHPLFGDKSYGGDKIIYGGHNSRFKNLIINLLSRTPRQMLHAKVLGFYHPILRKEMYFEVEYPTDMDLVLKEIRNFSSQIFSEIS